MPAPWSGAREQTGAVYAEGYRQASAVHGSGKPPRSDHRSIHEGLINQVVHKQPVVRSAVGLLRHVHGGELLLGVDPEIGPSIAAPVEGPDRCRKLRLAELL